MAPGTILFVQEGQVFSETKTIQTYSLHSFADGEVALVASGLGESCNLSPDGTMVSSYGFGYDAGPLQVVRLDANDGSSTITSNDSWTGRYYDSLGWSVDGQRVYFTQGEPEPSQFEQLSTIQVDGMARVDLGGDKARWVNYWPESGRITWSERSEEPDSQPEWMRDLVAFTSDLDGTDTIEWDQGQDLSQLWSCGDHVVWQNDSRWYVAGLDGSDKRQLSVGQSGSSLQPFFSPDCSQVVIAPRSVFQTGLDHLAIIDLASGAQVQSLAAGPGEEFHVLGWVQTEW